MTPGVVCTSEPPNLQMTPGVVCTQGSFAHYRVEAKNHVRYNTMWQQCAWHIFSFMGAT